MKPFLVGLDDCGKAKMPARSAARTPARMCNVVVLKTRVHPSRRRSARGTITENVALAGSLRYRRGFGY